MFSQVSRGWWQRGDRLIGGQGPRNPQPARGMTRRQVLLAAPAVSLAGLAAPLSAAVVSPIGASVTLALGKVRWVITPEAFGLTLLPQPTQASDRASLAIPNARWPGTGLRFDLLIELSILGGSVVVRLASHSLGMFAALPFSEFTAGGVRMGGLSTTEVSALAKLLGWGVARPGAGELRFYHDLSWQLATRGAFAIADPRVRTSLLQIRAHGACTGPLDQYRCVSGNASTASIAIDPRLTNKSKLNCGQTIDGREIVLRPRHYAEVASVRWASGEHAIALNGTWRLDLRDKHWWQGGFDTVEGLVLIGTSRGVTTIRASLPIAESAHSASLPGASATIFGIDPDDQALIESRDGVVSRCEVRSKAVRLSMPLEGVDYCQLELSNRDVVFVFDGGARPHGLDIIFGGDRWRLPLNDAVLRIARAEDLLNLAFSFKDMDLVRRRSGWQIEGVEGAGPSLMRVEFAPQHILERAFLRQLDVKGMDGDPAATTLGPINAFDLDKPTSPDGSPMAASDYAGKRDVDIAIPPVLDKEKFERVVEARLSGPSRLVFEIPKQGKKRDKLPILPLDLTTLTDWSPYALKVARPAQQVMGPDPLDAVRQADAPRPPVPVRDPGTILAAHIPPNLGKDDRLKAVVGQIREPGRFETAIEIPARLFLSPDQRARFKTPRRGDRRGGAVELWTARLDVADPHVAKGPTGAAVRAIWSPDFKPEVYTHGSELKKSHAVPWEPPATARDLRLPMDSADRHELVALTALHGLPTLPRLPAWKTSTKSPVENDADSLPDNILPPKGYHIGGFDEEGIYLPPSIPVRELKLSSLGGSLDVRAKFEPPAAPYLKDTSLSLFPALNIETWNQVTALGRDVSVEVIYKGYLFPLGHRASLVKLTERYFFPQSDDAPKPVAYLVQRYFIRVSRPSRTYPRIGHPFDARQFPSPETRILTTRTPDIVDPTGKSDLKDQIYSSGGVNLEAITSTTNPDGSVTNTRSAAKGLVFWPRVRPERGGEVQFAVKTADQPGAMTLPLLFLDNTAAHEAATVEAAVEYYMGLSANTGLNVGNIGGAPRRYAPEIEPRSTTFPTDRWLLGAAGRGDRPGAPYRMDSAMEGADQPPFYPTVREAHIKISSIQQFTGRAADVAVVSFDPLFVERGFSPDANPARIFMQVHGYLPVDRKQWYSESQLLNPVMLGMGANGDRAGAVAQPNMLAVNLSPLKGPIGGQAAPPRGALARSSSLGLQARAGRSAAFAPTAAPGTVNRDAAHKGIFSGVDAFLPDATILGMLQLRDLVKPVLAAKAPKLLEKASAAANAAEAELQKLLSEIIPTAEAGLAAARSVIALLKDAMDASIEGVKAGDLYPRLVVAIQALEAARSAADIALKRVGSSLSRIEGIVSAAKDLNASASGLLEEIDRVAQSPMPANLTEFLGKASEIIGTFSKLKPSEIFKTVIEQASSYFSELQSGRCETLVALAVGPDAYKELNDLRSDETLEQKLSRIGATAAEGLAYETLGRPALDLLATLIDLKDSVGNVLAADLRTIEAKTTTIVAKLIDLLQNAAQGPLLVSFGGGLKTLCSTAQADLMALVTAADTGLSASRSVLDPLLENARGGLASLALLERQAINQLGEARKLVAKTPEKVPLDVQEALDQAGKLAESVARARVGAAAAIGSIAETLSALDEERNDLALSIAQLDCMAAAGVSQMLGSASRWMALRLRALDELQRAFAQVSEALGIQLSVSANFQSLASPEAQRIVAADNLIGEQALRTGAALLADAGALMLALTSLRSDTSFDELMMRADAFRGRFDKTLDVGSVRRVTTQINALASRATALKKLVAEDIDALRRAASEDVQEGARKLGATLRGLGLHSRDQERAILGLLLGPLGTTEQHARDAVMALARKLLAAVAGPLSGVYEAVGTAWMALRGAVSPDKLTFLDLLLRPEIVHPLFDDKPNNALLTRFEDEAAAITGLKNLTTDGELRSALRTLEELRLGIGRSRGEFDDGKPPLALYELVQRVSGVFDALVQGRILDLIDLASIRREVESAFLDLVLPNVELTYEFDAAIGEIPPFFKMLDQKKRNTYGGTGTVGEHDLALNFTMSVDLKGSGKPSISSKGVLQPFQVDLFKVVTLEFLPATFSVRNGESPVADIKIANVQLGAAVSFVDALQSYLSPGGSGGFFIEPRLSPPSIEAGYSLDLGTISIGTVSFLNVTLGASIVIPFDNQPALYKMFIGRRPNPVMISVFPFGGGAFFSLISNSKQIVGFEASFEYGGVAAFGIAGIRGQAQITTGIYIAQSGSSARISGFFRAAGSAQIACFSAGACLLVQVEQNPGGAMEGTATYTFSFSLGLTDVSYSFEVARLIAKGWGGGGSSSFAALEEPMAIGPGIRSMLKLPAPDAVARLDPASGKPLGAARVRTTAVAMNENWPTYQRYFDEDL
jgi:hypothetical protein